MTTERETLRIIESWMEGGRTRLPDHVLDGVLEQLPSTPQRRPPWSAGRNTRWNRLAFGYGGVAAAVLVAAALGAYFGTQPSPTPPPSPTVAPSPSAERSSPPGFMWPQSTLEEVRAAQELADAGDPRYTWQVSRSRWYQPGQNHPHDDEFFARFLEEKLGWEAFRWDEALPHLDTGDVVYVRCASGETNPLRPDDPEVRCAPTLDELRYETVKVNVAQLIREGPDGIWVVTGWEMIEPFQRIAPPSDAEIQASMGAFLQARIDGEGAEGYVDFAETGWLADERVREVPLLYSTSNGSPYERSEFDVLEGPAWPEGHMQFEVRLFAQNDETVVEQVFSLARSEAGALRFVFGFDLTTENGNAVPVEYGFLDGDVTYRAADPFAPSQDGSRRPDRLAIVRNVPGDEGEVLTFLADPQPAGPGCGEAPANAEALARSIQSEADFQATPPQTVTVGGIAARQVDLTLGRANCSIVLENAGVGDRARLYLVDLPDGSGRVLVLAIVADEDSIEAELEDAAPILESIEFHAP